MKKRKEQVLSLLLSVMLLLGMMTVVTVAAEEEGITTILYENHFDSADDIAELKATTTTATKDFDEVGGYTGGAAKFTYVADCTSAKVRTFNSPSITFKKGGTYTVSFRGKGSVATAGKGNVMLSFSKNPVLLDDGKAYTYPALYPTYATTWKQFTKTFTIEDFVVSSSDFTSLGLESVTASLLFEPVGFNINDVLWIDDIVVTETLPPTEHTATVNISGEGTVSNGAETVKNGDTITVDRGGDLTLTLTPAEGNRAEVKVNGEKQSVVGGQIAIENITENITVEISFTNAPTVLYENHFDSADDIASDRIRRGASATADTNATMEFLSDCGHDGGALQFTYNEVVSSKKRLFMTPLPDLTFKKGATYTISFWTKSCDSGAGEFSVRTTVSMSKFLQGTAEKTATKLNLCANPKNTWSQYTNTFTVEELADDAKSFTDRIEFYFGKLKTTAEVGDTLLIDDIVITETLPPAATVAKTGDYEVQKSALNGNTYVKAEGETFDYYAMRFLFALTVDDTAEPSDVRSYGAYMIPWDVLNGGNLASSSARRAFYDAAEHPITKTQSTFSVDLLGIPKAAVGRTVYVVPFVNGAPNLDEAYNEEIAE